jgi:exodeoxyribonuclease III
VQVSNLNTQSKGFKSSLNKGLKRLFNTADIILLQETKLNEPFDGFAEFPFQYWHCCSSQKGYAGTAVLSKMKPISVLYGIPDSKLDDQGRSLILEFPQFYLIASYIPNAGMKLERMDYKLAYLKEMESLIQKYDQLKPVIWGGDLNVAHKAVDLARPKTNLKTPGYTPQEREAFSTLIENCQLVDTYRHLNPNVTDKYTYYSYRFQCHAKNIGWRLDYFMISERWIENVLSSEIESKDYGISDHVPITLTLSLPSDDDSSRKKKSLKADDEE